MKYLITGASGFLGGRLSYFLENKGHEVLRGTRNIEIIKSSNKNSNWVLTDFENLQNLRPIFEDVDYLIHAAGPNAEQSNNDSSSIMAYSELTKKLTKVAKDSKIKRIIYLSTIHVYNKCLEGLINEQTPTLNNNNYSLYNLAGEKEIRNNFGCDPNKAIILRLSNIFGYPINSKVNCWSLFINNICKEIVQKKTITIKSNPLIKRDFLSVRSLCEIIIKLSFFEFKDTKSNIINFGSENVITLLEAAKFIRKIYIDKNKNKNKININILKPSVYSNDFKFCNQILENNNLNFRKIDYEKKEVEDLLDKCKEYFNS